MISDSDSYQWCCVTFFFQVFYRPMMKMSVMSRQYINQLFPNLDALIKIHGKSTKPLWFCRCINLTTDNSKQFIWKFSY